MASKNLFGAVDDSLTAVQERVAQTQARVHELKVTTEDIEESIKNWTTTESREGIRSHLGIEQKAERLASGLAEADHWLDLGESSVQLVKQALEAASSLGVSVQTDPADRWLEELAALRRQLAQAIEPVERMRDRATEGGNDTLREEKVGQIMQLAVRVMATLGLLDSRLENLKDSLTELQTKTRTAEFSGTWWIRLTSIGIALLIAWSAAGQGALCYLGCKGLRERHSGSTGGSKARQLRTNAPE